ncbi:MAG: hypothetical protein FJY83_11060, partial [Candidatus Aminicenantes bacterium]|nr:hypothetical protein [Candidatus Aminicenantes bacterium]
MRRFCRKKALVFSLMAFACVLASDAKVRLSVGQSGFCYSPRIAFDSSGNIHVCWVDAYGDYSGDVLYTRYSAGAGQWSTPVNISGSGRVASESMMMCDIGVDSLQRVHIAWAERAFGLRLRTWTGESWTAAEHLASYNDADYVRLAVHGSGDLFIIWFTWGSREVFSRARVDGTWEGVRILSDRNHMGKFPAISTRNGI